MRKEFYIIDKSTEPNVIGNKYPQCSGLRKEYDDETDHSLRKFAYFKGKKVSFSPDLDGIVLHKSSKITDFISCSLGPGNDSIISLKLFDFLEQYELSEMQFFDCYLYKQGIRLHYKWVHYIYSLERQVDYQASTFTHPDQAKFIEIQNINSYENFLDFYNKKDEYGLIRSKNLVLKNIDFDFFVIGRFNQKLYVSERIKNKLIDLHIKGIDIKLATDIEVRCK